MKFIKIALILRRESYIITKYANAYREVHFGLVMRRWVLCDRTPRTMSGGEPSSIKRNVCATQLMPAAA